MPLNGGPGLGWDNNFYTNKGTGLFTSPTSKGVIFSGGVAHRPSKLLLELTGDSLETLKWTVLDQQLNHARSHHVNLSISDSVCTDLIMKYNHKL